MPLIELKSRFLIPRSRESSDLSNVLAKEFQSFFRPLNIMQVILFCPKYFIRNNVITRNGPKANAFCILGNFFIILIWLLRIISTSSKTEKYEVKFSLYVKIFSLISKVNFAVTCLGFVINMFCNIVQGYNNVKLVLTLQKAMNVIKINKNIFVNLIFWNWAYLIGLCLWHFIFYFGVTAIVRGLSLLDFFSEISTLIFDINVLYAIRICVLIRKITVVWIKIVKNKLFSVEDTMFCKKMYDTLFFIKCACVLYNKVFQDLVRGKIIFVISCFQGVFK